MANESMISTIRIPVIQFLVRVFAYMKTIFSIWVPYLVAMHELALAHFRVPDTKSHDQAQHQSC